MKKVFLAGLLVALPMLAKAQGRETRTGVLTLSDRRGFTLHEDMDPRDRDLSRLDYLVVAPGCLGSLVYDRLFEAVNHRVRVSGLTSDLNRIVASRGTVFETVNLAILNPNDVEVIDGNNGQGEAR